MYTNPKSGETATIISIKLPEKDRYIKVEKKELELYSDEDKVNKIITSILKQS